MDDILETKAGIRKTVSQTISSLSPGEMTAKNRQVARRLYDFANFMEASVVLLYKNKLNEVDSGEIIRRCYDFNKVVVLPLFLVDKRAMRPMKVDNPNTDLIMGPRGILEPNPVRCKAVPIEFIDIAIIPGTAFDEKGGRMGSGEGYYDRLIPKLPVTTRKVALAFEFQIMSQVPMTSHDKHVDMIITEERVIYKI
ncbi:MAG: 5-formyltetrahydrofolate cyclo-ligase [Desulfobacteraceae bacterium]|nr:5-formyltetrahydrofolate cyclo-ligase [Desulfobacteraceae bacterium]MBU4002735.1 5-formyltetrahydrofolate cyclo-ligase [Pseudomonadota bacterium]MBU4055831.1 5-formyltetrahydrofolate cyclo-ligase [Pseudomonadota bacterium]